MKKLLLILVFCSATFATVDEDEETSQLFTCNGSTTTFTFTLKGYSATDFVVYKRLISTDVDTYLTKDTDYSITATGGSYLNGGVVTISPALSSLYKVYIVRSIKQSQEISSSAMTPSTVAYGFDKVTRLVQDLHRITEAAGIDITSFWSARITNDVNVAEARMGLELGYINVMDYGAIGDGITDDTTAIQNVFDNRPDGATIFFPPTRIFKTTDTITITGTDECTIKGGGGPHWNESQSGVIWCNDPNKDIIHSLCNTFIIEGMTFCSGVDFNSGGATVGATGRGIIFGSDSISSEGCWIRNCWFTKITGDNIVMNTPVGNYSDLMIRDTVFEVGSGNAVTMSDYCKLDIRDCHHISNPIVCNGDNSHLVCIGNNLFYAYIDVNSAYPHHIISDNTITQITDSGAGANPPIKHKGNFSTIANNNIWQHQSNHGIYCYDGRNNNIVGNTLYNNQQSGNTYSGIYLGGTEKETSICSNIIVNSYVDMNYGYKYGISTESTTTNILIGADNFFRGWSAPTNILGTVREEAFRGDLSVVGRFETPGADFVMEPNYPADANLVMYIAMSEGAGSTAADSSGNSNNGTITSATWTRGYYDYGLSFDGDDDLVDCGSDSTLDDLGPVTFCAWIKPESLGEGNKGRLFSKKSATGDLYGMTLFLTADSTLWFLVDYSTTDLSKTASHGSLTLKEWQHVAIAWDGTTDSNNADIYVNGTETGYQTNTSGAGNRVTDASYNMIVGNTTAAARTFDGVIDDVRVFNKDMNDVEILAEYKPDKQPGSIRLKVSLYPYTDDTYYLGKNDDDNPAAWKGLILKDTSDGKYYRIEVIKGVITATDLTD